eukprot:TRINITY_DN21137_c0_g1_i1.p1 TRINITY_DN21137_c0_g1~~TRINITY_DN21137_c0_g1_i1.p1  ORF type:complete len:313 (+),score=74.59 TRINITY_DN21137_c0_g1_i1:476-1414(+)
MSKSSQAPGLEVLGNSIPKRGNSPTTLAELKALQVSLSPRLKDYKLVPIVEVPSDVVGRGYYDMQLDNPLFAEAKLTKEEIVTYGTYLADRAKYLAGWNQIVMAPDGTVAGMYLAYPARSEYKEEERAKMIPKVCEEHWQTCLWFEERVIAKAKGYLKKNKGNLLRAVFTGCHPSHRGMGIYEYVGSANALAAELSGYTHAWTFTFNSAFIKKALNSVGLADRPAAFVADTVPRLPAWYLEYVLTPTFTMLGLISDKIYTFPVPRNGISWVCTVWPLHHDPTVRRTKPKVGGSDGKTTGLQVEKVSDNRSKL